MFNKLNYKPNICVYNLHLHCRTQQMYLMNNRRINSIMMPLHTSISVSCTRERFFNNFTLSFSFCVVSIPIKSQWNHFHEILLTKFYRNLIPRNCVLFEWFNIQNKYSDKKNTWEWSFCNDFIYRNCFIYFDWHSTDIYDDTNILYDIVNYTFTHSILCVSFSWSA